ncbi:MAG: hypothetical protein HUK03_02965 [Bacteroidaceae bacterium]|nr:hypothetical protein [Bacteroidaceae bacterium]
MKSIRRYLCLVALVATSICVSAQKAPSWTKGYYKDCNNSYIKTASAISTTIAEARNKAVEQVIADRSNETGLRTKVSVESGGDIKISGSDELTVKSRVIDEYAEQLQDGSYRVHLLVQVAKNPMFSYDEVKVTEKYAFSPTVFVPGMAQIRKGSTGKGIFFIAAETVCIGGIILGEAQRASYNSKIKNTQSAQQKVDYQNSAKTWETVRNISIAGVAAFYVWNVIDGIVAKGKKHVVVGGADVAFAPYCVPEASGLACRITF